MRAINVLLALVVSAVLALAILEVGLRVIGLGPQPTLNRFDKDLGWSKTPGAKIERKTREFDVHFEINQLGLRDDPMPNPGKPTGQFRVLFLGDSFVLGYTVERHDLFVDILETWWKGEGRNVDCINSGTEGWSTDQELLWYEKFGKDYTPDVVVLCPYENDLFWNGETSYFRFPKPRVEADGTPERRGLIDPGPEPAAQHWALGRLLGPHMAEPEFETEPGVKLRSEWACYFHETPQVMVDPYARTKGALMALKEIVEHRGARLLVAPIPNKACIEDDAREALVAQVSKTDWLSRLRRAIRGKPEPTSLAPDRWSPDEPVERVLAMCKDLAIETVDARPALKAAAAKGDRLYFQSDWHFNPDGNRVFAAYLHDELDQRSAFPAPFAAKTRATLPEPPPPSLLRGWMVTFAILWIGLTLVYKLTYPKDAFSKGVLICGGMLALVFTIALGGGWLIGKLPHSIAPYLGGVIVLGVVIFLLVKLGRRLGTVVELLVAFTRRGHWYLLPLVVVLLTVGSLLVIAASSPLVAPFIYTLF